MDTNKATSSQRHVPPARHDFADETTYLLVLDADRTVRSVAFRRRFIKLDTDLVGMARGFARDGDKAMIFAGARTPYVVRKLGPVRMVERNGREAHPYEAPVVWTVVGECYVIGAMDGEILKHYTKFGKLAETVYLI